PRSLETKADGVNPSTAIGGAGGGATSTIFDPTGAVPAVSSEVASSPPTAEASSWIAEAGTSSSAGSGTRVSLPAMYPADVSPRVGPVKSFSISSAAGGKFV